MADVTSTVSNAASGVVGVIKALIVLFVFVNIIYSICRLTCFAGFSLVSGIITQDILGSVGIYFSIKLSNPENRRKLC